MPTLQNKFPKSTGTVKENGKALFEQLVSATGERKTPCKMNDRFHQLSELWNCGT